MMEFDEIVVKESPGLCRCCLSEGCYKDLGSEYTWMNETEVYADMLLECFDISITQHNEGPNGPNRLICEVCITRLRDACNFKKQVLDSEKKFIDMMGRGEFRPKMLIYQTQMKCEDSAVTVEAPTEETEVEYLDDDIDFVDDTEEAKDEMEPTVSDITVSSLPIKNKRGRPRKNIVKTEKKAKIPKLEEKPKTSKAVSKGESPFVPSKIDYSMSSIKRNKVMKRNTVIILENSTVIPFKWHRQDYLCFYCHQSFKEPSLLKEHTKNSHKTPNIKAAVSYIRRDEKVKIDVSFLQCRICSNTLDDLDDLIQHLKQSHSKNFFEVYGLGIIPYNLQNDAFHCAICKMEFQYFIKLNQHMNDHFGNYICESCGKSFLSQERLRCHSLAHGSKFRCNECPAIFDSMAQKNSHESKIHNKGKMLKCSYCPETFPNYNQRKMHHHSAHDEKIPKYSCPECGKIFLIISKMRLHVKEVHMKERNFACTMCDKKFFSRTHVVKHMVKHGGEKVHQCEVCKKSYARKQTLRDHMRIHDTDKRYVCSECTQTFTQYHSLRLHVKVHHANSVKYAKL